MIFWRFLEIFKDKSSSKHADVPQYYRQYPAISDNLVLKEKLHIYTRSKWFLQVLPFTLRTAVFYRHDLDLKKDNGINFEDLLKKALILIEAKKQMVRL